MRIAAKSQEVSWPQRFSYQNRVIESETVQIIAGSDSGVTEANIFAFG